MCVVFFGGGVCGFCSVAKKFARLCLWFGDIFPATLAALRVCVGHPAAFFDPRIRVAAVA